MSRNPIKKTNNTLSDELRPEYDVASMKGGVRGKHFKRFREGTNIVLVQPEVAEAFPTEDAVNEALRGCSRALGRADEKRSARKRLATERQPLAAQNPPRVRQIARRRFERAVRSFLGSAAGNLVFEMY